MLTYEGTWLKIKGWALSIGGNNLLNSSQHPLVLFMSIFMLSIHMNCEFIVKEFSLFNDYMVSKKYS